MPVRKWVDPSQPQTLQGAVLFCYLNAALGLLYLLTIGATIPLILIVAAVGANGIANERKWGYWLAIAASAIYVLTQIAAFLSFAKSLSGLLNLAFAILLLVLLLHPDSRHYQKIWFH